MLVLTKGDKGGDPNFRQKEQEDSARILKVEKLYFGNYLDTEIVQSQKLITEIEGFLKDVKPGFIFVHYFDDILISKWFLDFSKNHFARV